MAALLGSREENSLVLERARSGVEFLIERQ